MARSRCNESVAWLPWLSLNRAACCNASADFVVNLSSVISSALGASPPPLCRARLCPSETVTVYGGLAKIPSTHMMKKHCRAEQNTPRIEKTCSGGTEIVPVSYTHL